MHWKLVDWMYEVLEWMFPELEWLIAMEVKWKLTDGMEVVVGDAEYGIGLETPVADSKWNSVPSAELTAPGLIVPESELVTELETVGALRLHFQIGSGSPLPLDTIRSSTLIQGRLENAQDTWQHCQTIGKNLVQHRCIHIDMQLSPG